MKFKKIRLRNIRSYKSQEIEFPDGSILLAGDVGSGKTSILLALEYALFGLQPGQKGSSLLRSNAKIGEVDLEFEVAGKEILLERKLKRSPKGVSNEYAAITIDGTRTESSVTEIKSKVVSLLGYPPEFVKRNNTLYRYTVYTPQEQMKQIILEDIESRMNILRHIFAVDKYKTIRENLSLLIATLKNDSKLLQVEIKALDQDKEQLIQRKSQLDELIKKVREKQQELLQKISERKSREAEVTALEKRIEERRTFEGESEKTKILLGTKRDSLSIINRDIESISKSLSESTIHFDELIYNSLLKEISLKKEEIDRINSKYLEAAGTINLLEQERQSHLQKKDRVFSIKMCPTCLQNVSEVHKHNILNETESKLSELTKQLEIQKSSRESSAKELELKKSGLKELESKKSQLELIRAKEEYLSKSRDRLKDLEKQTQILQGDISLLERHLETLKESILKYSSFENQYKKKQFELKQAFVEEKNVEISLAELKTEQDFSQKEISLLEETIRQKETLKQNLFSLNETTDWLSTQFASMVEFIERNVLLRLRAEFSKVFRKWFLMLVPENSLDCQVDENFTPIIVQGDTEMEYDFLSGGERTAVALAYRLALNQTVNSILSKIQTRGIVILDEPTDGFSEAQIQRVRDILEELNASQLIIVSHEAKIESFVDNVIRVTKATDSSAIDVANSATSPVI